MAHNHQIKLRCLARNICLLSSMAEQLFCKHPMSVRFTQMAPGVVDSGIKISYSESSMNLANLPESTTLFALLKRCALQHEIVLQECYDGALIFQCIDCPFIRVLDFTEEKAVREEEAELSNVIQR